VRIAKEQSNRVHDMRGSLRCQYYFVKNCFRRVGFGLGAQWGQLIGGWGLGFGAGRSATKSVRARPCPSVLVRVRQSGQWGVGGIVIGNGANP